MNKIRKILLLVTLMLLTFTSMAYAAPIADSQNNRLLETQDISKADNGLILTMEDTVKICSPEEYFEIKAKETGIPVETIREKEIQRILGNSSEINTESVMLEGQYRWISKIVTFINNSDLRGSLQVGCEVYCNFDRIQSVVDGSAYAMIATGASDFEVTDKSLSARYINDSCARVSGPVNVRTTRTYSLDLAVEVGLPGAGFGAGSSTGGISYYYKIVQIYADMRP